MLTVLELPASAIFLNVAVMVELQQIGNHKP